MTIPSGQQTGDWQGALEAGRRAIEVDPANAEFHNSLGATLLALGKVEEAEASFGRAVQLRPDYAEAHHNLGLCRERLERWPDAEQAFAEAVRLRPRYPSAHLHLGRAREMNGDFTGAEAAYRGSISSSQTEARSVRSDAAIALCGVLRKQRNLPEAERVLRIALDEAGPSPALLNHLGVTLSQLHRLEEAARSFEQAVRLDPKSASARANLGTALLETGNADAALTHLETACRMAPRVPAFVIARLRCLQALGRDEAAVQIGNEFL